jgi:hypothetical protein
MHGTFPPGYRRPPQARDAGSLWTGFAFAALPWVIAAIVAVLRFGTGITPGDILDIIVSSTLVAQL